MIPFFSIITVVRNDVAGFQATAESLYSQTRRDFEWIVVDGASTDKTVDEIEQVRGSHFFPGF
ncbi:MAG: glycosyltransferase [Pseudomonadota bacterium]|nr:glycosyltransferase [Pseudomonadota bacterium]